MFEDHELDFDCPGCGAKNSFKLGQVKGDTNIVCVGCGQSIKLEDNGVSEGLDAVNKGIADFDKTISGLNKRR